MYVPTDSRKRNWEDFVLVIPAVSVGNVGQLAADLLISTLWMERVGYIYHESIVPVIGNNPFAHEDATSCKLTTCCEVYESISNELVVIQQRAPFVKGKRAAFVRWLAEWIKEKKFVQVYLLTTSYGHERIDQQLQGTQFRYLLTPAMEKLQTQFLKSHPKMQPLERREPVPGRPSSVLAQASSSGVLYIPGGGIAKQLFELCQEDVALAVLVLFCMEGDNTQDALAMATYLNEWTSLVVFKTEEEGEGVRRGSILVGPGGDRRSSTLPDRKGSMAAVPEGEGQAGAPPSAATAPPPAGADRRPSLLQNAMADRRTSIVDETKGMTSWKVPTSWKLVFGTKFDPTLFH